VVHVESSFQETMLQQAELGSIPTDLPWDESSKEIKRKFGGVPLIYSF
jgi:hypothetical protein